MITCDANGVTIADLRPTDEVLELRARVRAFMEEHVYPNEPALSREDEAADALVERLRGLVKEQGLWAPHLPPEAGGSNGSFLVYAHLNEEIGRSVWAQLIFGCQAPDAGNGEILWHFGTDEQKERWLRPLVAGEVRSFFSMTEPEVPGSDPTTLRTRAVRDGDEWVIDGHKWFSSGAEGAAFGIVMAVTDPEADPHRRATPDHRPGGHARRGGRPRGSDHGTPRSRLDDALRGALHGRARPCREHAGRGGRRLPHRAEAARARPHPPRHALARPDAARVRAHVHLRARAGGLRRPARGQADRPELDRGLRGRDPGLPPADARRRAQDRPGLGGAGGGLGHQVLRRAGA